MYILYIYIAVLTLYISLYYRKNTTVSTPRSTELVFIICISYISILTYNWMVDFASSFSFYRGHCSWVKELILNCCGAFSFGSCACIQLQSMRRNNYPRKVSFFIIILFRRYSDQYFHSSNLNAFVWPSAFSYNPN